MSKQTKARLSANVVQRGTSLAGSIVPDVISDREKNGHKREREGDYTTRDEEQCMSPMSFDVAQHRQAYSNSSAGCYLIGCVRL